MRLFVSEYLTSGAWPNETLETSLAVEGKSMLLALLSDLAALPDCKIITTWDSRLGPFPWESVSGVTATVVSTPDQERRLFQEHAATSGRTFVIAPEFDAILSDRIGIVESVGGVNAGCSKSMAELCSDKLRLAAHLHNRGVSTVETASLDHEAENWPLEYPIVVKPRYGAGSQQTFLISDPRELESMLENCSRESVFGPPIVQPFVPGETVSVVALVSENCKRVDVLPIAGQRLSRDGRFRYLGGQMPVHPDLSLPVERLVRQVCDSLDGLNGYIGIDLILPKQNPQCPVLLEINPRLTTSYLGYRELLNGNLAERILFPDRFSEHLDWKSSDVRFFPDGRVETLAAGKV